MRWGGVQVSMWNWNTIAVETITPSSAVSRQLWRAFWDDLAHEQLLLQPTSPLGTSGTLQDCLFPLIRMKQCTPCSCCKELGEEQPHLCCCSTGIKSVIMVTTGTSSSAPIFKNKWNLFEKQNYTETERKLGGVVGREGWWVLQREIFHMLF